MSLFHNDGIVLISQSTTELTPDMLLRCKEVTGLYLTTGKTAQHNGTIHKTLMVGSQNIRSLGRYLNTSVDTQGVINLKEQLEAFVGKGEEAGSLRDTQVCNRLVQQTVPIHFLNLYLCLAGCHMLSHCLDIGEGSHLLHKNLHTKGMLYEALQTNLIKGVHSQVRLDM